MKHTYIELHPNPTTMHDHAPNIRVFQLCAGTRTLGLKIKQIYLGQKFIFTKTFSASSKNAKSIVCLWCWEVSKKSMTKRNPFERQILPYMQITAIIVHRSSHFLIKLCDSCNVAISVLNDRLCLFIRRIKVFPIANIRITFIESLL